MPRACGLLGIRDSGHQVDVVYDPMYTDTLTNEAKAEHPFLGQKLHIGEHIVPRLEKIEPSRFLRIVSDCWMQPKRSTMNTGVSNSMEYHAAR